MTTPVGEGYSVLKRCTSSGIYIFIPCLRRFQWFKGVSFAVKGGPHKTNMTIFRENTEDIMRASSLRGAGARKTTRKIYGFFKDLLFPKQYKKIPLPWTYGIRAKAVQKEGKRTVSARGNKNFGHWAQKKPKRYAFVQQRKHYGNPRKEVSVDWGYALAEGMIWWKENWWRSLDGN